MKLNTLLLAILFLVVSNAAFGQSISIFDIDTTNFPTMKAKFYAFDKDGNQIRPSASELSITEDGVPRTITNVSCPLPKPPLVLSSVLVIDVSGSMNNGNLDLAKTAANAWVNGLPVGKSECAISSFDDKNYLNQDFTTNKNKLTTAINNLNASGGTNYDAALITPIAGGLQISKKGKHKKVLVMLTDGQASAPQTQAIINEANNQNCVIFCVTLGMSAPQSLFEIAKQTGGQVFENVTTVIEAEDVYRKILHISQEGETCEINWVSGVQCLTENIKVELNWNSLKSISSYKQPIKALARLQVIPSFISFGKIAYPEIRDTTITLTAINSDITINDIKLKFGSNIFSIINTTFPIIITNETSKTLTLRCTQIDSSLNYASFEIETDICSFYFSSNGGYPVIKMKKPTLKLTHPNGGEVFVAGSDTLVTWEGISPSDTCKLEFSNDSGKTWKTITNESTNLKYYWKQIPLPKRYNCLIQISQKKLKTDLEISDNYKLLFNLNKHKNYVDYISWSPDGSRVATASTDATGKIWDANTGQLLLDLIGHIYTINIISWSPDGSRVATASMDQTGKIWDTNTGQLLFTLNGHSHSLSNISWSPDGSKVATSSYDFTGKIWDANTGQLIHTLSGHQFEVFHISWSPDGSKLATASGDKKSKIWDANTGQLIHTLSGNQGNVTYISWSPDGSKVATSGYQTGKIWDAINGQLLYTLIGHSNGLNDISWSPDGSKVATTSTDQTGKIWDANTGKLLQDLKGHISYVYNINWSPDGSKVATASLDNTGKIWDTKTGKLIHTLSGHREAVRNISWSPDGSRVATSSYDFLGKIWGIEESPLQSDQSDAVFSIVAPSPSSRDIDMKECLVGVSKDSLILEFVMNKGNYSYRVDSVYFTGADASAFSQVSSFPKFKVDTNSSKTVELRFNPSRVGLHQAKVNIITQTDTLIQNITGTGIQPTIQIVNDLIDFGYVDIFSPKDTLQAVTIKNISNVDIDIKNTYHSGPNDKDFSTIKGGGAFKLKANVTAKLDMRFLPKSVGRTSGTLMFEYDGIGSPAVVELFGAGIGGVASLKLDTIETETSKIVEYPVKLTLDSKVLKSGANAVNFDITYNNTLLFPLGNYPITNDNGLATLKFTNVPLTTDPIQILETLRFKTGLGNAIETPLTISNFELVGTTEDIEVVPIHGNLKLTDVCYDGGVRLLNPNSVVTLARISPNPVTSSIKIDLNLIEIGKTEVSIYNLLGEKVKTLFSKDITETGSISINSDLSNLSNGQYVVIFTTPTYTERSNILVIK